jgi:Zn-dependent peptidase ImmA (M78 family)
MVSIAELIREHGRSVEEVRIGAGITAARMREIIGGAEPSVSELRRLAETLRLSMSDFLPVTPEEERAEVLFRERAAQKHKSGAPVEQFTRRVGGTLELLGTDHLPSWLAEFPTAPQTYKGSEFAAEEFRRRFFRNDQFGPFVALPSLLVNQLAVLLFVGSERAFDGASAILRGHVFVFVAAQFKPRMLFTLAHEVAHLLVHHNDRELVVLDASDDVWDLPSRDNRQEEAFANAFASALLVPRVGVGVALQRIKALTGARGDQVGDVEILYLSRIFGVSFEVAARRCEDLGLLLRGGARSMYEHLRKKYGSPEKRADLLNLPPRPEIEFPQIPPHLVDRAMRRIRSGEISVGRASQILNVSIPDIFLLHSRS